MKGRISFAAIVPFLITAFLVMGAAGPDHERDDEISKLRARIASLELRVEGLEKKLRAGMVGRNPTTRRPSIPSPDQSVPKGWRRREFDARPYFISSKKEHIRSRQRSSQKSRR